MKVTKITNSDVYFLGYFAENIIINRNYDGFSCFDGNLIKKKDVSIKKETAVNFSYIGRHNILMYCDEDNSFLEMNSKMTMCRQINRSDVQIPLPSTYYELDKKDRIIIPFNNRKGAFVFDPLTEELDFRNCSEFKPEEQQVVERCNKVFAKGTFLKVLPQISRILYLDKGKIYLENFVDSKSEEVGNYFRQAHQFDYLNGILLQIDEEAIEINIENQLVRITPPNEEMYFINGFISDKDGGTRITILTGNKTDNRSGALYQYNIDELRMAK